MMTLCETQDSNYTIPSKAPKLLRTPPPPPLPEPFTDLLSGQVDPQPQHAPSLSPIPFSSSLPLSLASESSSNLGNHLSSFGGEKLPFFQQAPLNNQGHVSPPFNQQGANNQGHISPLINQGHISPLINQGTISPFNQQNTNNQGHISPFNQGHVSPFDNQGHASPFNQGHISPFNQGHVSPFNQGHGLPFDNQGHGSPFNQGHASPFDNQGHASPFDNQGHASPFDNQGHGLPFDNQGHGSPFNQGHASPFGNQGHLSPLNNQGLILPFNQGHIQPFNQGHISPFNQQGTNKGQLSPIYSYNNRNGSPTFDEPDMTPPDMTSHDMTGQNEGEPPLRSLNHEGDMELTFTDLGSSGHPGGKEDEERKKKIKKEKKVATYTSPLPPCKICGAKASGLHYGVNTCEACKGFFRRAMKFDKKYKCHRQQNCDVTGGRSVRTSCPYCRLQKCINMGMAHGAIKTGRYTHAKRTENIMEVKRLELYQSLGKGTPSQEEVKKKSYDELLTEIKTHVSNRRNSLANGDGTNGSIGGFGNGARGGGAMGTSRESGFINADGFALFEAKKEIIEDYEGEVEYIQDNSVHSMAFGYREGAGPGDHSHGHFRPGGNAGSDPLCQNSLSVSQVLAATHNDLNLTSELHQEASEWQNSNHVGHGHHIGNHGDHIGNHGGRNNSGKDILLMDNFDTSKEAAGGGGGGGSHSGSSSMTSRGHHIAGGEGVYISIPTPPPSSSQPQSHHHDNNSNNQGYSKTTPGSTPRRASPSMASGVLPLLRSPQVRAVGGSGFPNISSNQKVPPVPSMNDFTTLQEVHHPHYHHVHNNGLLSPRATTTSPVGTTLNLNPRLSLGQGQSPVLSSEAKLNSPPTFTLLTPPPSASTSDNSPPSLNSLSPDQRNGNDRTTLEKEMQGGSKPMQYIDGGNKTLQYNDGFLTSENHRKPGLNPSEADNDDSCPWALSSTTGQLLASGAPFSLESQARLIAHTAASHKKFCLSLAEHDSEYILRCTLEQYEAQQIKSETFGIQSSLLSDAEFLEIYKKTGLDVDDRIKRTRLSFEVKIHALSNWVIIWLCNLSIRVVRDKERE